jgi:tetratricopeptide (TPR) repeat protein
MSQLLEILGRGVGIPVDQLILQWLKAAADTQSRNLPKADARRSRLNTIIDLAEARKYQAAQNELQKYVVEYPDCPYGHLAAAAFNIEDNLLEQAIEQLKVVYARQPSNMMALYALGHCYERKGGEAEAVAFYQDCLKFRGYLHLPRQRLAAISFKNGQLEKTIHEYQALAREYPDDMATVVTLGYLYIAAGKCRKAAETFSTAILMQPDNFITENDEIELLIEDDALPEALERIDQLLADDPDRPDLIVRQADVLAQMGEDAEALARYEQAIVLCPDFLAANIKLGSQRLRMGDSQPAAQQFNHAMEVNDRIVDAYIGLATAQKLAGDTSEAIVSLSLAAAIDANSPLLFAETAALQFHTDCHGATDTSMAVQLPQPIVAAHQQQLLAHPHDPDLHYRLGLLLMGSGRTTEAAETFRKALEVNPTFARARNKLATCLYETDEKALALEELAAPDCLDHETLNLHYKVALLYCDRIKFASSLLNLEQSIEDSFASTDASVNISIALQNLGLLDRANVLWDGLSDLANRTAK